MARGLSSGRNVLLKLCTDTNLEGLGEVYCSVPFQHETWQGVVSALKDYYVPLLLGRDPFQMERIWTEFDSALPGNTHARCAVDFALWDLMGKCLNVPVCALLGGLFWEKIPLEYSLPMASANEIAKDARHVAKKYGVRYFCLKIGPASRWEADLKNLRKLRSLLGKDVLLAVDANASYSSSQAIKIIRKLETYDLLYVEQPVPGWDLKGMASVRRAVETSIMADESVFSPSDALRAIQAGAVDIVCIKLPKPGGMWMAKKVASVAEAGGAALNLGGAGQTGIGAAANAHFYASTKSMVYGAEFVTGLATLSESGDLLEGDGFVIDEGFAIPPKGPGLGIKLDEKALEKYAETRYVVEQQV